MRGHRVDQNTLVGASTSLISSAPLTPELRGHAALVVNDYARGLREREGLTGEQASDAADEILQMLGLIPSPPPMVERRERMPR